MIQELEVGDADEIRTQRALARGDTIEISRRIHLAEGSMPKEKEDETRDTAFAVQKRKLQWRRQEQGNQYGDSSSAVSRSASADEGGKETRIMSEKANQWTPWSSQVTGSKSAQPAQPYRLQQGNRGEGKRSNQGGETVTA